MTNFPVGSRVRNTVTREVGTVVHVFGTIINVRYDTPRRGYSQQRDEHASVHVAEMS